MRQEFDCPWHDVTACCAMPIDKLGPFGSDAVGSWGAVEPPSFVPTNSARARSPKATPSGHLPWSSRRPAAASAGANAPYDAARERIVRRTWNPVAASATNPDRRIPHGAEYCLVKESKVYLIREWGGWSIVETRSRLCWDDTCPTTHLGTNCPVHSKVICMLPSSSLASVMRTPPPIPENDGAAEYDDFDDDDGFMGYDDGQ